jgi:hypothetical protein
MDPRYILSLLLTLIFTLPAYAAEGGTYTDNGGPAPDVDVWVRTMGVNLQVSFSTSTGASQSSWQTVVPNSSGIPGDVWMAGETAIPGGAGRARIQDGAVQWKSGEPGSIWRNLRRIRSTCSGDESGRLGGGNGRTSPPVVLPSTRTVGTLPRSMWKWVPGAGEVSTPDELH